MMNEKVFKRCRTCSNKDEVMFQYQMQNSKYAIRPLGIPNPDDNLNCAEPWHDYGNWKSVGINESDKLFTLWDYVNRKMVVYNQTQNKVYSTKEEGKWWNHSESNDTPGRTAFDIVVDMTIDEKASIEEFFSSKKDEIFAEFKMYLKNEAFKELKKAEEKLKNAESTLEDLKINHKRAFRQIENAEKTLEICKRNYNNAKACYEKL